MVAMVQPASSTPIHPGDQFWVAFATDQPPSGDWIDIFPAGASNSATPLVHLDTTWQPAGQILMNLPASAAPGAYELRLRQGGTGVTIATYAFTAVGSAPSTTDPAPKSTPPAGFDVAGLVKNPIVIAAVGLVVAAQVGLIGGRRR
jgi:hypothetical protein